jgi:hypothetical protein
MNCKVCISVPFVQMIERLTLDLQRKVLILNEAEKEKTYSVCYVSLFKSSANLQKTKTLLYTSF